MALWQQIFVALILGALSGLIFGHKIHNVKILGDLFIASIHMIMVPVVLVSIVTAILSISDLKKMRRVTLRAGAYYFICMSVAAVIGILVASVFVQGSHFHPSLENKILTTNPMTFSGWLQHLIPSNPFAAFMKEDILQIVVFALLLGLAIRFSGDTGKPIKNIFHSLSAVIFKLVHLIVKCAPYGVFGLIAWTFGELGWAALWPLCKFILAVYIGCFIQFLVYMLGLWWQGVLSISVFFKGIASALLFSFTTASSAATLPLSMRCGEENLGIDKSITRFLLPLGASFNLNGLSIYLSVAVVFAASWFNIHLSAMQYIILVITIVTSAMGAAAIPGSALIIMGAVMSAVGVPLGAIALMAGVDRLNDMAQTATNVAGDLFVAAVVATQENLLKEPSVDSSPSKFSILKEEN